MKLKDGPGTEGVRRTEPFLAHVRRASRQTIVIQARRDLTALAPGYLPTRLAARIWSAGDPR
jgi:hypothetical protein